MSIKFGREICGDRLLAASREWLVTNGIGGYACGTISGQLTQKYHGLLIAALKPPLGRTLLVTKLEETIEYEDNFYPLFTNLWASGSINPHGYKYIESFCLEDSIPTWNFAVADALLEKRVWMERGANTTYINYNLLRSSLPVRLHIKVIVNYRDYHHLTIGKKQKFKITPIPQGICINALPDAVPFYVLANADQFNLNSEWYRGYKLNIEEYRGLDCYEDHFSAITFQTHIKFNKSLTIVASTENNPSLAGEIALASRRNWDDKLLKNCYKNQEKLEKSAKNIEADKLINNKSLYQIPREVPDWIKQLVIAADQFIVDRVVTNSLAETIEGKTIIAGYPWFSDWGRDTMISLPGLTLCTGRWEIAKAILQTFSKYIDKGMIPNRFPDDNETPDYNNVDGTLWYFQAIRAYYEATGDRELISQLWLGLADIIHWHQKGTRYNIHLDSDGLIYAGESGSQLTWMDVKIDDWVVTPRVGKPIEINALWYNALQTMISFADILNKPATEYQQLAEKTAANFQRFWCQEKGYCYDVLDTPTGNDLSLRPNQIFAVSLPHSPFNSLQQQQIVDICARKLLTSSGLRSLAPADPQYQGEYGGPRKNRDSAYHQGTVWGWLIGPFVLAHLRVYENPAVAQQILQPIAHHLNNACVGSLSEIFDGDAPFFPRGCFAQAWTVAEVLRAWVTIANYQKVKI